MKELRYTNADRSIDITYLTDLIGDNDMLTIYKIIDRSDVEDVFGFLFEIDEYTLAEMVAFASDNNFTLDIHETGQAMVISNSLTALNIVEVDGEIAAGVIAVAQIETLTFLASNSSTQADYFNMYNQAGNHFAIWLDIDAAGTPPTGALYVASDFQIEVDIVGGDSNIQVAGKVKTAIELDGDWTGFDTITDNGDGTLTFTNDTVGAAADTVPKDADDTGVQQIETLTYLGTIVAKAEKTIVTYANTAGTTQADYLHIINQAGTKYAIWMDIDANGTAPTGALYAASDFQIEIDIVTGDTDAVIAAKAKSKIELDGNWTGFETIIDNTDGTLDFENDTVGVADDALPKDDNDAGVGSIGVNITIQGVAQSGTVQGDYLNIYNLAGDHFAVWMDVAADGSAPTGALYVASDYQIEVDIADLDTNITVAGLVKAAIELDGDWSGYDTIVDNGDGTLTFTNTLVGSVTDAVPKDDDDVGAGTITTVVNADGTSGTGSVTTVLDANGVTATIYANTITAEGGNEPYVWSEDGTSDLPTGLTFSAAGVLSGVPTTTGSKKLVAIVTDRYSITNTETFNFVIS